METWQLSAVETAGLVRSGSVSAAEVAEEHIARIDAVNAQGLPAGARVTRLNFAAGVVELGIETEAMDTVESVRGALLDRLKAAVTDTARALTPRDRLRLIAVQHQVRRVIDWQPGGKAPDLSGLAGQGSTALYDGLAVGLLAWQRFDAIVEQGHAHAVDVLSQPEVRALLNP